MQRLRLPLLAPYQRVRPGKLQKDVVVAAGDFLLGDRDGVVIIPRDAVEEVVAKTEEVVATESEMRTALIGGMDPIEAYNRYGKF